MADMRIQLSAVLFSIFVLSGHSYAYSSYPGSMDAAIKNVFGSTAGYSASCTGCHGGSISATPGRQYGLDFVSSRASVGTNFNNIVTAMGTLDSDGDGATNQEEWLAGTDPSDATSHPVLCVRAAPQVSISPASQSGLAGVALSYSISVKNMDSASCQMSSFAVAMNDVSGISSALSMQSLALAPGASGSSSLTLTSDAGLAASSYPFSVSISESGIALHSASANGILAVQAAPVCVRAAPSVTWSPSSQMAAAGVAKSYSLKIVNNDSSACQASSFDAALTAQAPLSGSLASASGSIAAGQSSSISLSVQSDSAAMAGSYPFSIAISDAAEALHAGSVSGSLQVQASNSGGADLEAPSIPMNVIAKVLSVRRGVRISWDASSDNVGVAKYLILVDGNSAGETANLSLRLRLPAGNHEIKVKAADAAGNSSDASAAVQISLQAASNGGHSGGHRKGDRH